MLVILVSLIDLAPVSLAANGEGMGLLIAGVVHVHSLAYYLGQVM